MPDTKLYDILEVSKTATELEIKKVSQLQPVGRIELTEYPAVLRLID
jgi:hypothetical protein